MITWIDVFSDQETVVSLLTLTLHTLRVGDQYSIFDGLSFGPDVEECVGGRPVVVEVPDDQYVGAPGVHSPTDTMLDPSQVPQLHIFTQNHTVDKKDYNKK